MDCNSKAALPFVGEYQQYDKLQTVVLARLNRVFRRHFHTTESTMSGGYSPKPPGASSIRYGR